MRAAELGRRFDELVAATVEHHDPAAFEELPGVAGGYLDAYRQELAALGFRRPHLTAEYRGAWESTAAGLQVVLEANQP